MFLSLRSKALFASVALALSACSAGGSGANGASIATALPAPPAPLAQTTIDERGLILAWSSYDAALDAVDILVRRRMMQRRRQRSTRNLPNLKGASANMRPAPSPG